MTALLYLQNPDQFTGQGNVVATGADERGSYIILDQTIMYPQGGGQPADLGTLTFGDRTIAITHVGFALGQVHHYINPTDKEFLPLPGANANIRIDENRRKFNTRGHSAGHLVAHVAESLFPGITAIKGYHFPDSPHVEFSGEAAESPELIAQINTAIAKCINDNLPVRAMMLSFDELIKLCPTVPQNLPKDKPLRAVQIGSFAPVPCGGTHVKSLSEWGLSAYPKLRAKRAIAKSAIRLSK